MTFVDTRKQEPVEGTPVLWRRDDDESAALLGEIVPTPPKGDGGKQALSIAPEGGVAAEFPETADNEEAGAFFAALRAMGYQAVNGMMFRARRSGYWFNAEARFLVGSEMTYAYGHSTQAREAYQQLDRRIRQIQHFGSVDAALTFGIHRAEESRLRRKFAEMGEDVSGVDFYHLQQLAVSHWTLTSDGVKWQVTQ